MSGGAEGQAAPRGAARMLVLYENAYIYIAHLYIALIVPHVELSTPTGAVHGRP